MKPVALIVDDDLFSRQGLQELLERAGFRTVQAGDGMEAIRAARDLMPDVILLDQVMPVMDGVAACRKFRSIPRFQYTPIILMTQPEELEFAGHPFQIGADDFLTKPVDPMELVARVQGCLSKKGAADALERRARDVQARLDITRSVSSSLDSGEILRQMALKISRFLEGVEKCSLALVRQDERFGYVLSSSEDGNLREFLIFLDHSEKIREVLESGRTFLSKAPEGGSVRSGSHRSMLILPMRRPPKTVGAVVVRLDRNREALSPEEIEKCRAVIDAAADALNNAHRYRVLKEESDQLRNAKRRVDEKLQVKSVFEELFHNASEGLVVFDRKGGLVFGNGKALEILGCTKEELVELNLGALLDWKTLRQLLKRWRREGQGRGVERFEVPFRDRKGRERLLSVGLGERSMRGDLAVASFWDVTDSRTPEQAQGEIGECPEKRGFEVPGTEPAKIDFLTSTVHELREPVTVIHGFFTLLKEQGAGNLTPQQKEYLQAALEGSDHLLKLINNLLDISCLGAGRMISDIGPHDLCSTIRETSRIFRPLLSRGELDLTLTLPTRCDARYDEVSIQRVLSNLLGNAVKFSPPGGNIGISLKQSEKEVQVTVEDSGEGIPAECLPDLFEKLTRVDLKYPRRGTGIDLSICKSIIEAHQGRIWVESCEGRRSRFCFVLPRVSPA